MKIMMVHHFGKIGGGTNSCFDVCEMLHESGHDVFVVIPNPSQEVEQLAHDIGIRLIPSTEKAICLSCHNADSGTSKAIIKYLLSLKYGGYWVKLFKQEKPDLILFNSSVLGPLINLANKLGFKTICFIRETARKKAPKFWRTINSYLLSKADGLAYLTQYDISDWGISSDGYHVVIPDIVDETRFNKVYDEQSVTLDIPGAKYLLYLGGFSEEKGALDLLQAFEICAKRNPNLHLLLLGNIGDFSNLTGIQKFFRRRAIRYSAACRSKLHDINQKDDRVHVIGLVADVAPWYQKADAVVFPVKKVHQARPVYEAGLFQKPIIIPNFENFCDNVIDGYNGVLYRKFIIDDMAEKILSALSDEEMLRIMGKHNYDNYINNHTYHEAQKQLNKLLEAICG